MRTLFNSLYRNAPFLRTLYRPCRAQYARWRLKQCVRRARAAGIPLRIVIGANHKFQPEWLPTELYTLDLLKLSDWQRYFREGEIDRLVAEHVWEHLTVEQGTEAARMCFRFLRPGGQLRVAVPDGFFPDPKYIEFVRPGGTGPSADDHKVLYTYKSFREVFKNAGFEVRLLEYFDEFGAFHEESWDPEHGRITRSKRFYQGHCFGDLKYRSLILDARKGEVECERG